MTAPARPRRVVPFTAPPPAETLAVEDVRRWSRSYVYGWRRGDVYLYLGVTRHGLPRMLALPSGRTDPALQLQPGDVLDLWHVPPRTGGRAYYLRRMIDALGPRVHRAVHQRYAFYKRRTDAAERQRMHARIDRLSPVSNRAPMPSGLPEDRDEAGHAGTIRDTPGVSHVEQSETRGGDDR